MAFPWYGILLIVLGSLLLFAIVSIICLRIARRNSRLRHKETSYAKLASDEEISAIEKRTTLSKFKERNLSARSSASWGSGEVFDVGSGLPAVTHVKEKYAETCASDVDAVSDAGSFTAYGDQASNRVCLKTDIFKGPNVSRLQVSLIYNVQKKYIAGKITKIEDLPSTENGGPNQIKIHIVLFPAKKYILKTRYHSLNAAVKMDEYFKMKFKLFPNIDETVIRYRVYGRKARFGFASKDTCLGESFVYLADVAKSKGGVTMWKNILPKGLARGVELAK